MLRPWLVFWMCLPMAGGAPDPLDPADRALREGRPARAAAAFRGRLEARPDDPVARIGLAESYARTGRCGEALELLGSLRETSARARTVDGDCALRAGRPVEAATSYAEALALDPTWGAARVGLALAASAAGDGVDGLLPEILLQPRGEILEGLVAAQAAYDGGEEELDARLLELRRLLGGRGGARLAILDGRRWLDLDDPWTAAHGLREAARRHVQDPRVALWYAEALRRLGDAPGARDLLDRPVARRLADDVHARAILARLEADEGRLDLALARLAPVASSLDPEVIASAWYLAAAAGDAAAAERHARRWRGVGRGRGGLEALVPLHRREGA